MTLSHLGTFHTLPPPHPKTFTVSCSAFNDTRFQPVKWEEVPRLECTVSLLTNFEYGKDHLDWEVSGEGVVGVHCRCVYVCVCVYIVGVCMYVCVCTL